MSQELDDKVQQEANSPHHVDGESLVILFCITCVIISVISKEINKKYGIPYTPLLILFGIFLGYQSFLGQINQGIEKLMVINPHSILMIFLPILIFESSFNARLPSLSTNFLQVLILIVPAVIITALLIAFVLKEIICYADAELSYWDALTLGSILAATDPVAVVALLKELGAPIHINTIIEMESLFNDGTAMVFFTIFYEFSSGRQMDIGESIVLFLRLALGGIGLGILFGIGALFLLFFLSRGRSLFMHIIVVGCYSVFYVGETLCEVSGLLAIVALGITLNKFMKDMMTNDQVHAAEEILSYIQFLNESLLFFFAGVIIGYELGNKFVDNLFPEDWGYVIVLFIFIVLIRFVTIGALWPLLIWTGEGFSFAELLLSVWGGLRGALGIALSLVVFTNFEIDNPRTRTLVLFHTCGVAALTLIVNGTTAKQLVEEIHIIQNVNVRNYFKGLFMKQVKKNGVNTLEQLKFDPSFSMTLWRGVEDIVQFDQIDNERKHIKMFKSNIISKFKQRQQESHSMHRYQILRHMLKFLCDDQHEAYFYYGVYGVIEEAILQSCELPHNNIDIWSRCNRSLRSFRFFDKNFHIDTIGQVPIIGFIVKYFFYIFLNDKFIVLDVLHKIIQQTILLERNYEKKMVHDQSVMFELQQELNMVEDELNTLKYKFAEHLQKLSQQHAAVKILRAEQHYLDSKMGNLVADKEGTDLRTELFQLYSNVSNTMVPFRLQAGKEVILQTAFKEILDHNQIHDITNQKKVEYYKAGAEIVSKDDPSMCVIVSGQVEERIYSDKTEYKSLMYAPGNIAGLANLIDRSLNIQIVAIGNVEAIKVELDLNVNIEFAQFCYKKTLPEFLKFYSKDPSIQFMNTIELIQIANNADIYFDQDNIVPKHGGFIFEGSFSKGDGSEDYSKYEIIPESNIILKSKYSKSVVALFKTSILNDISVREPIHNSKVHPGFFDQENHSRGPSKQDI